MQLSPDRVRTKLGNLETYLQGLKEKQDCTWEEYRDDQDLQDIVERRFEKTIQACTDIAAHIVSTSGFREPKDTGDLFRVLEEEELLPTDLADSMVEYAGFRNVLAHEYASIKDKRVHTHLQDLSTFHTFAETVNTLVQDVETEDSD